MSILICKRPRTNGITVCIESMLKKIVQKNQDNLVEKWTEDKNRQNTIHKGTMSGVSQS
jgi:hypothetical protein